ncbi:hypothetical protein ACFV90_36800 [Streptomyces sp. NPDC059904]|uniref:hypothetical protein n=1 Tax=Streptomyces sp. NPDC059904 TaxID=3346996 RepID=UPI003666AFE2
MPAESYTRRENRQRVGLTFKAVRHAIAGAPMDDLEPRAERIRARAEERGEREADRMWRELDSARSDAAAAKVKADLATGSDRAAARRAAKDAERNVERIQRKARKYL